MAGCTVSLSLFAGRIDSSEASTDLLRSHASLPPEPVNRAVQYLRGFMQFTCYVPLVIFTVIKSYWIVENQKES